MDIVHTSAEYTPFIKVGGLGDVLQGLTLAQIDSGHNIEVVLPYFTKAELEGFTKTANICSFSIGEKQYSIAIWKRSYHNISLTLLQSINLPYFPSDATYGTENDLERYCFFSLAAFHYITTLKMLPTILHIHEWTTALLAPLIKRETSIPVVFTIHNLSYQGILQSSELNKLGLVENILEKAENPDSYNLLKSAIVKSDCITTVSPTYAQEIQTKAMGEGLDVVLKKYKKKLRGILNGITTTYWDPQSDAYLPYLKKNSKKSWKEQNKQHLLQILGINNHLPIFASVTRLVPQKGLSLIEAAIEHTAKRGAIFLLLGSSPISSIEKHFLLLQEQFSTNNLIHFFLQQSNESLAHQIFAAADFIVIPSLFEPCGLTQLLALRYGAIPIVRQTGGLKDTVIDIDKPEGNGITFIKKTKTAMQDSIDRALNLWHKDAKTFDRLTSISMDKDYSWKKPAQEYEEVYTKALKHDLASIIVDTC